MGKLHELAGEQLNPVDDDITEVSHYSSGTWSSLKLKLSTLRTYIGSSSNFDLAKLGVITSSYTNPTPCQNMTLKIIHIKHVSGSPKFRVGSSAGTDDLLNEIEILEDTVLAVFIPCYLLFVYPRIIGAGSLNVTLEFSNNLFD